MSGITTHVLDTARGRPAAGVPIRLAFRAASGEWGDIGHGSTDADGRLRTLTPPDVTLERGTYRLTFDTGGYFASLGVVGFYPEASIVFDVRDGAEHYHVPLLLQPFGYSTYRGS
jgi:5-hydroxyisourate hydrolase